jgi:hypothetical protein
VTLRALAVVIPLLLASLSAAQADEVLPPELTPYRVALAIDVENSPEFAGPFGEQIREQVRRLIGHTIGERWSLSDAPAPPGDLDALTVDSVPVPRREAADGAARGLPEESAPDKTIFASVRRDGPGYVASAREWDRLTDTLGPVRTSPAVTRDDIPRAVVRSLLAAFRPVASIGRGDAASAALTFRAGGIPTPDPAAGAVEMGALFTAVLRRFDRDGTLAEVRPVPLTLIRVPRATGGTATAEIDSALRSPLGARRGRIEAWAIAAPVAVGATRLTITRQDDGVPLAGRVVEVRSQSFTPGKEEKAPEQTLLTDRSGSIMFPADPKRPLLWLTVRSGDATLARLPLAPGVESVVMLPLGDDQRRLDAEARLSILTGDLIEAVAKRATLLARARASARAGQYAAAETALAEAAKLPDAAAFRRRLAAVETPAAKAAEEARDRLAAARIRALGRQAGGLIDRYLNPDALRATREEVEELKRTDPDAPAAPAGQARPSLKPKPEPAAPEPSSKPAVPPAKRKASEKPKQPAVSTAPKF